MIFTTVQEAREYVQTNKIQCLKTHALFDCLGFIGYSTEPSWFTRFIAYFEYNPNYKKPVNEPR